MASSPLDIISLAQGRVALRQVGQDSEMDAQIEAYIVAAVEAVDNLTKIGMLTRRVTSTIVADKSRPIRLVGPALANITEVRYRAYDSDDGILTSLRASNIATMVTGETYLRIPIGGWPANTLVLSYKIDLPAGSIPSVLRAAALLLLRDLQDAKDDIVQVTWSVTNLIAPYRSPLVEWGDDPYEMSVPIPSTRGPTPAASVQILRTGWSADTVPTNSELTASSVTNTVTVPSDNAAVAYFLIWRADAAGGDPASVRIGAGGNSRNLFGAAIPLADQVGVVGQVIVSVTTQKIALLSGEKMRII